MFLTNKFWLPCNVKTNCHHSDLTHVAFSSFCMERYKRIKVLTYVSSVVIPIQWLRWRQCALPNDTVQHSDYTQSFTGLSPGWPGLNPKSFYVKSVVDKMALENNFCQLFLLAHVCIIPPVRHIHSSATNTIYYYIMWHICNKTLPSQLHNVTTHKTMNYIDISVKATTFTHKTPFHNHCSYMVAVSLSRDAENNNKFLSWW